LRHYVSSRRSIRVTLHETSNGWTLPLANKRADLLQRTLQRQR
jgi:hypothetical protein